MFAQHLTRQDLIKLLEIINESLECSSEEHLRQLLLRLNSVMPYQAAASGIAKTGGSSLDKNFQVFNMDYPSDYLAELSRSGLIWKDPALIENFKKFRMQYWDDTIKQQGALTPDMLDRLSLAEDFGFQKIREGWGYSHGVQNPQKKEESIFAFHGLKRSERTEEILRIIIPHFHQALCRLRWRNKSGPNSHLTPKETEILKWVKQGKTSWDIAMILGISSRTVKFHMKNIFRKLDAVTRAHAVAVAMEKGLLDMD